MNMQMMIMAGRTATCHQVLQESLQKNSLSNRRGEGTKNQCGALTTSLYFSWLRCQICLARGLAGSSVRSFSFPTQPMSMDWARFQASGKWALMSSVMSLPLAAATLAGPPGWCLAKVVASITWFSMYMIKFPVFSAYFSASSMESNLRYCSFFCIGFFIQITQQYDASGTYNALKACLFLGGMRVKVGLSRSFAV